MVGCSAFYDTQNSGSPHSQVYQARCLVDADNDPSTEEVVTVNTACEVNGKTYCTISSGRSYCLFDSAGLETIPPPNDTVDHRRVVFGPEAVIVQNDTPVFLVNDGSASCAQESLGCEEYGAPTYTQDKNSVTAFVDVYLLNRPDDYGSTLCSNEALFCEEFSTTQDGNFYFKDPSDKTCEYKTGIQFGSTEYRGWFRAGLDEPCYWTDVNSNGVYNYQIDTAYLVSGETSGVWRNGDAAYDGWVAECNKKYDRCTEFIDPVDVGAGLYEDGISYYYVNNERLDEEALTGSQRCNGQVSQKEGCVLFNNLNDSQSRWNASASYVVSVHADDLIGTGEPFSLQDPVSCPTGGQILLPDGSTVDLCTKRCQYQVASVVTSPMAQQIVDTNTWVERSCFVSDDCPGLKLMMGHRFWRVYCVAGYPLPTIRILF